MNKRNDVPLQKDFYWLFFCSLFLLFLVAVAFYRESTTEWKHYQSEFKDFLKKKVNTESASGFKISVKQIWMPELNRVDRCVSCHLGYDQPNLKEAPEPFTAHPDIKPHSFAKMGCTICHGGQGFALKKKEAHGEVKHWEEPLLGREMARKYGFSDEHALIQINCNICHRRDEQTAGMERINLGKRLLTGKKKCQTCHLIEGKGGNAGADLTYIGDKPSERFDFSQIKDKLVQSGKPVSILSWHFEHFRNPEAVVPESKMPAADYSPEEAWALSMLMMSWKNVSLPVLLVPRPEAEKKAGEEEKVEILSKAEWGEKLFEEKGCSECHTIGKGSEVGPDLLGIVKLRDIEWLKKIILNPEEMEEVDSLARKLFQDYGEIGMPNPEITEEEAEAIIEYLSSFRPDE